MLLYPAIQERLKVRRCAIHRAAQASDERAWPPGKRRKKRPKRREKILQRRAPIPPSGPRRGRPLCPLLASQCDAASVHSRGIVRVIWFQAEANLYRSAEYARLFPEMIKGNGARSLARRPALLFRLQVANQAARCGYDKGPFSFLREAQMAGHGPARHRDGRDLRHRRALAQIRISKNKQEVGRRLAAHRPGEHVRPPP